MHHIVKINPQHNDNIISSTITIFWEGKNFWPNFEPHPPYKRIEKMIEWMKGRNLNQNPLRLNYYLNNNENYVVVDIRDFPLNGMYSKNKQWFGGFDIIWLTPISLYIVCVCVWSDWMMKCKLFIYFFKKKDNKNCSAKIMIDPLIYSFRSTFNKWKIIQYTMYFLFNHCHHQFVFVLALTFLILILFLSLSWQQNKWEKNEKKRI